MITGTMKWFDVVRGYGFIVSHNGGKDVYVHRNAINTTLTDPSVGLKVKFEVRRGPNNSLVVRNVELA